MLLVLAQDLEKNGITSPLGFRILIGCFILGNMIKYLL